MKIVLEIKMTSLILLHKHFSFSLEGCVLHIIPDTWKTLYTGTFLVLLEGSLYVDQPASTF